MVPHRGSRTSATHETSVAPHVGDCFLGDTIEPNPETDMITKFIRAAALSALLSMTATVAVPAGGARNDGSSPAQTRERGDSMMGMGGMGGMGGGMMGSCPMMGGNMGMDPKTAMRMHADMMRAMSDIMLKYADQAGATPSK